MYVIVVANVVRFVSGGELAGKVFIQGVLTLGVAVVVATTIEDVGVHGGGVSVQVMNLSEGGVEY